MLVYNTTTNQLTREPDPRLPAADEVVWVRLHGHQPQEVERVLGRMYGCHPLLVEDCIKLNQRPKLDRYANNVFLTFFAVEPDTLDTEEFGIVIGPNYVITVCKQEPAFLETVTGQFEQMAERMHHPSDILHYILDHCVDEYSDLIDRIESRVETMEQGIYANPYLRIAHDIFRLKRDLHQLRRIITEERSILSQITQASFPYAREENDVYFIDIYDHISRVVDSLDMFRESLTGLLELQMSMKSDRMNVIMKTLTIISTIFLPLSFIVGLYGMNFRNIPELNWTYGYLYVWLLIISVAFGLIWYFKRKKWM
jgi:magnesium transporter